MKFEAGIPMVVVELLIVRVSTAHIMVFELFRYLCTNKEEEQPVSPRTSLTQREPKVETG